MENLTKKTVDLLNYRIQQEEMSSRIYLCMSNELNYHGYAGAGKLWKQYSEEEQVHANKAYKYLLDLDYLPIVPELPKVPPYNGDFVAIIKASYEHEQEITRQCKELYKAALAEGDILTTGLAQWYVTEQVEELSKVVYWLDRLEAFGTEKNVLRLLDEEMGDLAEG